jgi:hypothetical protein
MVAGAVAGNLSPEATSTFGNNFADATRERMNKWPERYRSKCWPNPES